ncbi:hypothetical protein [Calothrix sp. 336/3]|nr:hypothetical protein [Calothrix sp. 336/3]
MSSEIDLPVKETLTNCKLLSALRKFSQALATLQKISSKNYLA